MRAAVVPRQGPPEVIEVRSDWPEPDPPGPGEVLLRVEAAGLNPSDAKIRAAGASHAPGGLPYVAGREAAGQILQLGPDVTGLDVGDPVFCFFGWDARPGGHAERLVVRASAVARRPAGVHVLQAAGVPLAGLTALQGLQFLDPPPGERLLVTAGAGGVGHFAVQLGVLRDLEVVATASPSNHDFLRGLGAVDAIDYRDPDATKRCAGARYMLDAVGAETIARHQDALGDRARVAAVAGLPPSLRPDITSAAIRCRASAENLTELARLLESGDLATTLQEVFPLERVADAHRLLEGRHVRGKLVIEIGS